MTEQTAAGLQPSVGDKIGSGWWPGATATVTQLFGVFEAILGINSPHTGIDFALPNGTPLNVPQGVTGTVTVAGADDGFGNAVKVDIGNGVSILLGHMKDVSVTVGQQVNPGDLLGHVDSTGLSTGDHVHFQVEQNGSPINPWAWVQGAASAVANQVQHNPVAGLTGDLSNVGKLAGSVSGWVTDAKNWWRVLFYLLGGAAIAYGLWLYLGPRDAGGGVTNVTTGGSSAYRTTPVPAEDTEAISAKSEAASQGIEAEAGEAAAAAAV